jgi:hypothetical protein
MRFLLKGWMPTIAVLALAAHMNDEDNRQDERELVCRRKH